MSIAPAANAAGKPADADVYLPYMRDVTRCEQSLGELNVMWRMIESSARMNCPVEAAPILPTIAATREGFKALERELVQSLVREKVATVQADIATRARYVIDIVVRNLYERTADVGFLAIDEELCRFVAGGGEPAARIRARLQAYRSKYSVYDEILLLDTAGNVLLQADGEQAVEGSRDPLIADTLASSGYVETFRASDLRPGKARALIYSRRMLDPDSGAVVGVLCLCFAFEDEMAGIFAAHRDPQQQAGGQRSNMLLVDGEGVVLAAADPDWIRPGSRVPLGRADGDALVMYCGRQHLVRTFAAAGYQGYPGPAGWHGQVMIPLDVAFGGGAGRALAALPLEMASGLLTHAHAFCPPLHEILGAAETIRRVVWNGQVMTAGQGGAAGRLKVVLDQIGETGKRSDELFAESIGELYDTALAARLANAEYVAQLVVDLLDRNLYERANDCRWWALTPLLRQTLAEQEHDWESLAQLASMLDFINGLYTVYTRLFVYDERGVILESSRNEGGSLAGQRIGQTVLRQVLALGSEQDYVVSPFEATPLYGGRPTYVYHAAVRDPYDARRVVGGIGIVFDSERELAAMLAGALGGQASVGALLVERDGTVIASTDPARPVGAVLDGHAGRLEALQLGRARGMGRIIVRGGQYTILGAASSAGYREFRRSDVVALVYDRLGEADPHARAARGALQAGTPAGIDAGGEEFATFHVDGDLFAMAAGGIVQALPGSLLQPLSMGRRAERAGVLALPDGGGAYVWVFDLRYLVSRVPTRVKADSQVVIVQRDGRSVGLLVGALDAVVRFAPEQIVATPFGADNDVKLVPHVIKAGGDALIQLVDSAYLFARLFEAGAPEAALAEVA